MSLAANMPAGAAAAMDHAERIQGVQERAFDARRSDFLHDAEDQLDAFADALDGEFLPCGWSSLADIRKVERATSDGTYRAANLRKSREKVIGAVRSLHAIYRDACKDAPQTANELALGQLLITLVNESADRAAERAAEAAIPGDH